MPLMNQRSSKACCVLHQKSNDKALRRDGCCQDPTRLLITLCRQQVCTSTLGLAATTSTLQLNKAKLKPHLVRARGLSVTKHIEFCGYVALRHKRMQDQSKSGSMLCAVPTGWC